MTQTAGAPAASPPDGSAVKAQPPAPGAKRALGDNTLLVTALAFVAAMVVGAILIAVSNPATRDSSHYFFSYPWDTFTSAWHAVRGAYVSLFQGAVFNPHTASSGTLAGILGPLSNTLARATPLILGGLSVGLAFRAGLFNIGGQGQIILGAVFAGYAGFAWHLPIVLHVIVAILAGVVGGGLWGALTGWLKARFGAHEVITTIMLNYVALYLLAFLLSVKGFQRPPYGQAISNVVDSNAQLPNLLGSNLAVNSGFLIALAAAYGMHWLLTRSTLGFQFRAVGANQFAARTAGMSVEKNYVRVMVVAGVLSGLAGVTQILGGATNYAITPDIDAGIGFDAITVALLGRANAGGTVLAGLLFGALKAGAVQMQSSTGIPVEVVEIIQALIVLFIAAPALVRFIFRLHGSGAGAGQDLAKGWNG